MAKIVCKYTSELAFFNRLKSLGLVVRDKPGRRSQELIEDCNTPLDNLIDTDGNKYVAFECSQSQADKLPPDNNPAFACIWKDYEIDPETGEPYPYPVATADSGRIEEVGRIS